MIMPMTTNLNPNRKSTWKGRQPMNPLKELVELLKEPEMEMPMVKIDGEIYSVEPRGAAGYQMTNVENPLDVWNLGNEDGHILMDYAIEPEEIDFER